MFVDIILSRDLYIYIERDLVYVDVDIHMVTNIRAGR